VSVTFSGQVYDACTALDLGLYAVSPHPRKELVREDGYRIEHRPRPGMTARGRGWYFIGETRHVLGLIWSCLRYRAHIAVVADCGLWPLWAIARCFGVRIVAVLHCALWPSGFRPTSLKARILQRGAGWFWEHCVDASLVVSPECARQIRTIAPRLETPLVIGLSHFRKTFFATITPPSKDQHPFRVMFAGRIERNKGVFDLVEAASLLEKESPDRYRWEVCGGGSDEAELKDFVEAGGLSKTVLLLGQLNQDQMGEAYGRSHAVIVPTTSHFAEGLVQVAVESVLAGRPVVTSRLCHGLDLLADAVVEVEPGDVQAYAAAIQRLCEDPALYEAKRKACEHVSQPFLDKSQSWGHQLQRILRDLAQE